MKQVFISLLLATVIFSCKKIEHTDPATGMNNSNTESTIELKSKKKFPPLSQYITTISWRGARVWYTQTAAWVDSVTSINFYANGQVEWIKQGWEFVPRTPGTYSIQGNDISINFHYPPYTHTLQGSFDRNTGIISGIFTEIRAVDPTAPPAYVPGTTTGEFNFYKK